MCLYTPAVHDTLHAEPQEDAPDPVRSNAPRVVLAAVFIVLVCVVLFSGAFDDVTIDDIVARVQGGGAWGVLGFLLAFAALQPVGVSSHIFTAAAGLIWAPWFAVPIALTGAVMSACVCYFFARFVAYDWVRSRLKGRLLRYEEWLVERGVWGMIVFRLLTYTSQPALFMMGTTRVSFRTMLIGSIVGFIPMVCLGVFLGGELLRSLAGFFGA